jgi:MFS family permease
MKTKPHLLPWLMWILAASFYCYEFFLQVSPGVMANSLMHSFAINATNLGTFAAVYFYAYLVMQIPGGVLIDYFGARRLLTCSALICALGTILFATTHIFLLAVLGRLLIGLGSASAYISCVYIAATWLPVKRFSFLNGIIVAIGMLGAILGQAPLALLVAKLGWRNTMLLFGIAGILLALFMWFIIKDRNRHHGKNDLQLVEKKLLRGLKYIMRSKQTWICAIYGCLMYTPTLIFGTLWGVPFLTHKYHLSNPAAATLVAMLFLGWAIGSPLFGGLSDYFKRRKIFALISATAALLILAAVIYLPNLAYIVLTILLFCVGLFSSAFIVVFSIAREINPQFAVGAAMGFMNGINMLGGALIAPVIGFILDKTKFNYELGLSLLPIILVIALILALQIKETYAKLKFNHE